MEDRIAVSISEISASIANSVPKLINPKSFVPYGINYMMPEQTSVLVILGSDLHEHYGHQDTHTSLVYFLSWTLTIAFA